MIREFFINIPAVLSNIYFVKLQKKLSISVPLQVVNLVGRVIWGKRLKLTCQRTCYTVLAHLFFSIFIL